VLSEIEDRLGRGRSARQIHGELSADQRFVGRVPSIKTIWRKAKTFRPPAPDERWSLVTADPEEAAVVLPVFVAMAKRDKVWQCAYVTKAEAHVLVRIAAAAPDLEPWAAYRIAERYQEWEELGNSTLGLELGLALAPWRSEDAADQLHRMIDAGLMGKDLTIDIRFVADETEAAKIDPVRDAIRLHELRFADLGDDLASAPHDTRSLEEQQAELDEFLDA
jgi:hypothetical protein